MYAQLVRKGYYTYSKILLQEKFKGGKEQIFELSPTTNRKCRLQCPLGLSNLSNKFSLPDRDMFDGK